MIQQKERILRKRIGWVMNTIGKEWMERNSMCLYCSRKEQRAISTERTIIQSALSKNVEHLEQRLQEESNYCLVVGEGELNGW